MCLLVCLQLLEFARLCVPMPAYERVLRRQYLPGIVIRFIGSTTSMRKIKSLDDWDRWDGKLYIPRIKETVRAQYVVHGGID